MTREGPGAEIPVEPGLLDIELPEIPSSGYRWDVDEVPAAVEVVGTVFRDEPSDARRAGQAGMHVFTFAVAAQPGRHRVVFALRRPWEQAAIERRTVTLVVDPPAPP